MNHPYSCRCMPMTCLPLVHMHTARLHGELSICCQTPRPSPSPRFTPRASVTTIHSYTPDTKSLRRTESFDSKVVLRRQRREEGKSKGQSASFSSQFLFPVEINVCDGEALSLETLRSPDCVTAYEKLYITLFQVIHSLITAIHR